MRLSIKSAVIECIFTYARLRGFCLFRILYLPLKISNLPTKMIFSFRSGKVRILAKKYPQMWLRSKVWMRAFKRTFKPPRLKSIWGLFPYKDSSLLMSQIIIQILTYMFNCFCFIIAFCNYINLSTCWNT